jgi:hypothetical protein
MTTDGILNIVLAVAAPGLMAFIGVILALKSLPGGTGKRKLWWIAFAVSLLASG